MREDGFACTLCIDITVFASGVVVVVAVLFIRDKTQVIYKIRISYAFTMLCTFSFEIVESEYKKLGVIASVSHMYSRVVLQKSQL